MRRVVVSLVFIVGCRFDLPSTAPPGSDGSTIDAPQPDAAIDAPPPTIVYVQGQVATNAGSQTLVQKAFDQDQVAGNLNVVVVSWAANQSDVTSVVDTSGNTYTAALPKTSGNGISQRIFYAANIAAGPNTVTATLNSSQPDPKIRIFEYAGIVQTTPIDGTPGALTGNSTTSSSAPVTTTHAKDLLFAASYTPGTTTDAGPLDHGWAAITLALSARATDGHEVKDTGSRPRPFGSSRPTRRRTHRAS